MLEREFLALHDYSLFVGAAEFFDFYQQLTHPDLHLNCSRTCNMLVLLCIKSDVLQLGYNVASRLHTTDRHRVVSSASIQ